MHPTNTVVCHIRVTFEDSANVVQMGAMVAMQGTISRVKFLRLDDKIRRVSDKVDLNCDDAQPSRDCLSSPQ